jgi:uncharacterized protein
MDKTVTDNETMQNDTSSELHPRTSTERILTLDILRGVAIFGILLVNMGIFAYPFLGYQIMGGSPWDDTTSKITEHLIRFLAEGKFYSLFSLLFGIGIMLQYQRAESRNRRFTPYYLRRIGVLLIIGLLHALLLWMGDILTLYALCGFALLLFIHRKAKTILVWAVISLALPVLLVFGIFLLMQFAMSVPEAAAEIEQQVEGQRAFATWLIEGAYAAYRDGSFGEIFVFRAIEFGIVLASGIFWFPNVFAMMLIGFYMMKKDFLTRMLTDARFTRKLFLVFLLIGIPVNVLYAVSYALMDPIRTNIWYLVTYFTFGLSGMTLSLAYASGIILLLGPGRWQKFGNSLAAVGRMALTNYLMQSVICTTLFYSYGFGLYGSVGPAQGVGITILIFGLQLYISPRWLRHFHYGPIEWLWRSITYREIQPFKKNPG